MTYLPPCVPLLPLTNSSDTLTSNSSSSRQRVATPMQLWLVNTPYSVTERRENLSLQTFIQYNDSDSIIWPSWSTKICSTWNELTFCIWQSPMISLENTLCDTFSNLIFYWDPVMWVCICRIKKQTMTCSKCSYRILPMTSKFLLNWDFQGKLGFSLLNRKNTTHKGLKIAASITDSAMKATERRIVSNGT